MALILKGLSIMKNWLIAGGVFIAAIFASLVIGRRDQKKDDATEAQVIVDKSLSKISEASKDVQETVAKDAANPPAVDDSLRSDFTDPN
jgi:hypothetical protein